jgi:putative ABC transport system permease protein
MPLAEAFRLALQSILASKLRSFFTLLGIIVSVGFLVTVVAVIQGMNAYVKENITGAVIGTNAFQVRRTPIAVGLLSDEDIRQIAKRPLISREDAEAVRDAIPDALAVSLQSGWPTPTSNISYRDRTVGDVLVFGVTPPYQIVQDYRFAAGEPLSDLDIRERRLVAVLGFDVADKLFGGADQAISRSIRISGREMRVKAVTAKKGRVLGQSFDGFAMIPITTFESMYGRRKTTTVSVKMADAEDLPGAMARAEEAMRLAHRLRPGEANDFTVDKADALVAFWRDLTKVLFTVVPAVVCIGIVVGGIVIMNIMLMSVNERTREIGIRKSLGATRRDIRRQFLVEAIVLATFGGIAGVVGGWLLSLLVAQFTPLPARITTWSIGVALSVGASTGILFGVYPATRAARLDPITALRAE